MFDFDFRGIKLLNFQKTGDGDYLIKVSMNEGELVFAYNLHLKGNNNFDIIKDYAMLSLAVIGLDDRNLMRIVTTFDNLYNLKIDYNSVSGNILKEKKLAILKKTYFNTYRFDYIFRNLHLLVKLIIDKKIVFNV